MKKILVHIGSWKSASTLIQTNIRKNLQSFEENDVGFVDQNLIEHKENFAPKFRRAIQALQEEPYSERTHYLCIDAADAFKQITFSRPQSRIIHSWENFLGHPFYPYSTTLYHGAATSFWFKNYLGELDIEFVLVIRNQIELIEGMYNQEVRKGRFLDSMDQFLSQHVYGRNLTWESVIEPFFDLFDTDKIRVIPFEAVKLDSKGFVREVLSNFFVDMPNFLNHSNPSFSAKAISLALKNYPSMNKEERLKEERRLIKNYSNITHDRAKFVTGFARTGFLLTLRESNLRIFKNRISEKHASLAKSYLTSADKKSASSKNSLIEVIRSSLGEAAGFSVSIQNINGYIKSFSLFPLSSECITNFDSFELNDGYRYFCTHRNVNLPVPIGTSIEVSTLGSDDGRASVYILEVNDSFDTREPIAITSFTGAETAVLSRRTLGSKFVLLVGIPQGCNFQRLDIEFSSSKQIPRYLRASYGDLSLLSDDMKRESHFGKNLPKTLSVDSLFSKNSDKSLINGRTNSTVFITIDTESFYFKNASMIDGSGLPDGKFTIDIANALEKRGFRGVFYVNVYESKQYSYEILPDVCRELVNRGHEVALHSHKSSTLEFYKKEIVEYDIEGQKRILDYGRELITKWTNADPVNYRAGGYLHNSSTLLAAAACGFSIDSSFQMGYDRFNIHSSRMNLPYQINGLIEVPVSKLFIAQPDLSLVERKFDINSVNFLELISALNFSNQAGQRYINFMMHSFSFIERERFTGEPSKKYLLTSDTVNKSGTRIGVTRLRNDLFDQFCSVLDFLNANRDRFKVSTMRDEEAELREYCSDKSKIDLAPIIYR